MKSEELERIEELCSAVRKGPWKSFIEGRDHDSGSNFIRIGHDDTDDIELLGATHAEQDFIASARQDIPNLLAEVKRLKLKIQKLETS